MLSAGRVDSGHHDAESRPPITLLPKRLTVPPKSTPKVLQHFTRDLPLPITSSATQEWQAIRRQCRLEIKRLKSEKKRREEHYITIRLRNMLWSDQKLRKSREERLTQMTSHYFPPRASLDVVVCDFGAGRAERYSVPLGYIESSIKPSSRFDGLTVTVDSHARETSMGKGPMDVSQVNPERCARC
jgi:hypothetical protein